MIARGAVHESSEDRDLTGTVRASIDSLSNAENENRWVPKTSVVTTTERTFVIRDRNHRAEWVDVKKRATEGDLVEVIGPLAPGDRVVRRATDELRDGAALDRR
jgi:hypothetical protein